MNARRGWCSVLYGKWGRSVADVMEVERTYKKYLDELSVFERKYPERRKLFNVRPLSEIFFVGISNARLAAYQRFLETATQAYRALNELEIERARHDHIAFIIATEKLQIEARHLEAIHDLELAREAVEMHPRGKERRKEEAEAAHTTHILRERQTQATIRSELNEKRSTENEQVLQELKLVKEEWIRFDEEHIAMGWGPGTPQWNTKEHVFQQKVDALYARLHEATQGF